MKKSNLKRITSFILALTMVADVIPLMTFPQAEAASNINGTFEGQDADVFSALGFDTSEIPEGYDAQTVDNPYGRNKITGNQVFEIIVNSANGTKTFGKNNNELTAESVNGAPSSTGNGLVLSAVASGDFDGDGLAGEVAYIGYKEIQYNTWKTKSDLYLCVYDGKTNTFSDLKLIGNFNPAQVTTKGGTVYSRYDYAWQNLLQITAGDYDGDGTSEIAAYVADDGNCRVDIFKYQKTSESSDTSWLDISQWSRTWSHVISNTANQIPNMVSLVSTDINRDGIDDLGISSGRFSPGDSNGTTQQTNKSSAIILWGDRANMLQSSTPLNLAEDTLGEQVRVSLTTGDLDNDGYAELIATGQPLSDAENYLFSAQNNVVTNSTHGNTERTIITYTYDSALGIVINYSGLHKSIDGEYVSESTDDEEFTAWQSGNGFDDKYFSQPLMRTNAAAFKSQGSDYTYLYLDSCLYEYTEGQMTLKMSLDDESYDGQNTLSKLWGASYPENSENALAHENYVEYGAVSADINGDGFSTLASGYMFSHSSYYTSGETVYDKRAAGYMTLGSNNSGTLINANTITANKGILTYNETSEQNEYGSDADFVSIAMVDIDMDTVIIEYTGVHYLTYSDPKVLAILAAAPYFEDVDRVAGYDYAWQNTTSYSRINGEGNGDLVAVDLEVGAFVSVGKKFAAVGFELETSVNYTMEWEKETTKTTEYTLTFETSQNEDAVAFFSIPTENYVYKISTPDGNGGYIETFDTITNTFTPCYQILTLDYYESIQGNYDILPQISGVAIESTPGDPSSYPTSTSGYDVIAEWNDDPAGVSFGNGAITQEITVTEEVTEAYNMGAAWDFQFGLGLGTQSDFVQSEGEFMGGIQFSLNPTGGWSHINLEGTSFSGTVTNMPLEFQQYGYYYNWKLFAYNYKFSDGTSIPVVSYVVGDVTEPPELPEDFQQDYERSTSDTNVLTWTYDNTFSSFIIHKYYDFPVGGGLQEIPEIPVGCEPYTEISNSTGTYAYGYNLKYDDNGKQYKEYYFEDLNLAPYTEYEYAIQVERISKTPPLSSPSELVTVRTKAANGNPLIPISESDGENDGFLQIYPDKNSYLTVNATGPDGENISGYYTTVQYQWQKMEKGAWVNMIGETSKTLTFANAGVDTSGEYRCLVNVLTQADATAISAYTDSVTLNHSKRVSYIDEDEVYVQDVAGGGVYFFAKVRNAHSDSASIPSGTVNFTLTHNSSGRDYTVTANLNSQGVAEKTVDYTLPEGLYTVKAYYSGSYIFKSCNAETLFLSQRSNGLAVDAVDSIYYGEGTQIISRSVTNVNGVTNTEEIAAETYYLKPATVMNARTSGYSTVINDGDTVSAGSKYCYIDDGLNYYFTAEYSSTVHFLDGRAIYDISENYISYTGDGGKYRIAENIPAGNYIIVTTLTKGVESLTGHTMITVKKRPITVQLPSLKINEGENLASSYAASAWNVISGTWADCDIENGALISNVANHVMNITYRNTANTSLSASDVSKLCGAYTSHGRLAIAMTNYDVTIIDGSVAVLGGANDVNLGVRSFEGKDVGALYAISPDYASTRTAIGQTDTLVQKQATGTRLVFTAVPDEGYAIYAWYINGVKQSTTDSTISYIMLNEETTIEVQFDVKKNALTFGTAGYENGGTITCSDENLTSGSIILPNAYMTFTAQAKEGYHFKEWRYTESGSGTAYDDTDSGLSQSTFTLLMPTVSCSLYAVFERDYFTFDYIDESGSNGLTAWYSEYQAGTTGAETVYIANGTQLKGGTEITVEPKAGYRWNDDYNYVSDGSQGSADYENGSYTFTLEENTTVYGNTIQDVYDLTLKFDVTSYSDQPIDAQISYYINDEISGTFTYDSEDTEYTIEDIPGGSSISAEISYPSYYLHKGWTSNSTVIKATTEKNNLATEAQAYGDVTEGNAYWYSATNNNGVNVIYYFVATATGYFVPVNDEVVIYSTDEAFTFDALDADDTLTVFLTEKDVHKVSTADISEKGTYSFTLPEGSYQIDDEIYIHDGDDFDVLITPKTGWTVTYWNILPTNSPQQEVKATSLRYVIPDVTEDFVLTPIFAATSYNIISWPTISDDQNFLTLSEYNCVSSVASGASFSFKLSGAGLSLLESVYANGMTFVPEENGGNYTYTGNGADRIYTIKNIVENHSITVSFCEVGVSVNGTDVSALKGNGWYYDAAEQVLVLQKSNLTVSGTNDVNVASQLTISLEAESLTLDDFVLNSSTNRNALIYAYGADTVITLNGANVLNHSAASSSISALDGNLTIRGNGSITLKGSNIAQYEIITNYALNITGRSIVNIEGCNGDASSYMIYVVTLNVKGTATLDIDACDDCSYAVYAHNITIGSEEMTDNPIVRINGAYRGVYLYNDLIVYSGDLAISGSYYALRTLYGDIHNYGGITELSATNGGIIYGSSFYNNKWKIAYPVGYSVTYIDEYGNSKYVNPVTKSQYSSYNYDLFATTNYIFGWRTTVCEDKYIDEYRQIRIMPISSDWDNMTLSVVVNDKVYSSTINMDRNAYGYYYTDDTNNSLEFIMVNSSTQSTIDTFEEDPKYNFVAKYDPSYGLTLGKYTYTFDSEVEDNTQTDVTTTPETPVSTSFALTEIRLSDAEKYDYTISGNYTGEKTIDTSASYTNSLTLDNVTLNYLNIAETPVWLNGDNTVTGKITLGDLNSDAGTDLMLHGVNSDATLLVSDYNYPISSTSPTLKFALNNIKNFELYGNSQIAQNNQNISITYTDANGNELPYGMGWQINLGSNSASSTVQDSANLSTYGNGYLQVSLFSTDAKLNPEEIRFDKSNGFDNILGLEDALVEITEPIEEGTIRPFDRIATGTDDATGRIVLIDGNGNETELIMNTDYTWTRSEEIYAANELAISYATLNNLELGTYTVRIFYYDDDINDTSFYYSDITLTITDTTRISGSLNMLPIEPKIGRGESITFETDYSGTDPMAYEWILEGNVSENTTLTSNGSNAILSIADDEAIGSNITVTVKSYADEAMTKEIGYVIATVNVIAKATDINITCVDESPSGDDSYTLHHTTENAVAKTWDFNACIATDDGSTEYDNVIWSLWGNKLKATTINSATGELTVSPNETGTNGKMKLTATYTNADGSTLSKTIEICLSSDVWVGADISDTSMGTISIKVDGNKITGSYLPIGTTVVVTSDANSGYDLKEWFVNGKSITDNDSFIVDIAKGTLTFTTQKGGYYDISAEFYTIGKVKVSFNSGSYGNISAQVNDEQINTNTEILEESTVTFTAIPDYFCNVTAWYINDVLQETTEETLTIENITEDINVRVEFAPSERVITLNSAQGGSVKVLLNGEELTGNVFHITSVDTLILEPTADYGYTFAGWSGSVTETRGNSCAIIPGMGDVTVTPEFAPIPYHTVTIYTNSYQNGGGSVVFDSHIIPMASFDEITVTDGDYIVLTALSDSGSYLYSWTVEGTEYSENGNSLTLEDIRGDVTVIAKFRRTDTYQLTYPVDVENGSISAKYSLTVGDETIEGALTGNDTVKAGADVIFTLTPDENYIPKVLTANGNDISFTYDETTNTFIGTLEEILQDTEINVGFEAVNSYNVIVPNSFTEMVEISDKDNTDTDEPTNPDGSTDTDEPSNPDDSTDTDEPTNPEDSTDTDEPTNPEDSTETDEPTNPDGSTDTDESTNPDDSTDTEEPKDPVYEERIMGYLSIDFVADGASSFDENAEEGTFAVISAENGTVMVTFESAEGYEVDIDILKNQISQLLTNAESEAIASYAVMAQGVVVTLEGIDATLDLREMQTPFRPISEETVYYTVNIVQSEGGNIIVTLDDAIIENGAKVQSDAQLKLNALSGEHYQFDNFSVDGEETALDIVTVTGDVTISAMFSQHHNYVPVVTVEPTCTEMGYTTYSCSCGDSYVDYHTDCTNHSFTNYISDGNATIYASGTKTAKCDYCNATHTILDEVTLVYSEAGDTDIDVECNLDVTILSDDYSIDISEFVTITARRYYDDFSADNKFDSSLDMTLIQSGNDELSPYDLYWNAYNSGSPANHFSVQYMFDADNIDAFFNTVNKMLKLNLSYQENSDMFIGIIYDSNGNGLAVDQFLYKIAQRGDANLDNVVDVKDAALVAKYASEMANVVEGDAEPLLSATENELAQQAADVNGDGVVDAKDAALIAKYTSVYSTYSQDYSDAEKYYAVWNEIA